MLLKCTEAVDFLKLLVKCQESSHLLRKLVKILGNLSEILCFFKTTTWLFYQKKIKNSLCFEGRCGTQKCFGLDLVSAFPIERERLFAGYPGDERLRIEDIVHCVNGTRYAAQLRALNVFEKAMNGDVSPTDNALDGLSISKTTKRIVRAIAGGTRHGLDAYFGSILDGFQAAKQNVILDLYSMRRKQAFSFLAPFFLSSSTSSALKFAVKFHVISSLFENVRTVIVTNGSGAAHHAIGLSAAYLTYILSSLRALKDGSFRKLKWIKMRNVTVMKTGNGVDGKDALNRLVQRFEDRFRAQIGFDIYVERVRFCQRDYCTLFIAKMRNKERGHVT